jgi:hypothetical protein
MEVRLLVFLAFTCATVITNSLLIFVAYKAFAALTTKVDSTVSGFQKNGEVKQWLESMRSASEQAVTVTQETKERLAEIAPALANAQETFNRSLAQADSTLAKVASQVDSSAQKLRDVVAKPAFSVMAFAAGFTRVFEAIRSEDE